MLWNIPFWIFLSPSVVLEYGTIIRCLLCAPYTDFYSHMYLQKYAIWIPCVWKYVRGNLHFCYFSSLSDALECFFIKTAVDSIVVHNDDYYRQVVPSAWYGGGKAKWIRNPLTVDIREVRVQPCNFNEQLRSSRHINIQAFYSLLFIS
jgi:hypothetical protein